MTRRVMMRRERISKMIRVLYRAPLPKRGIRTAHVFLNLMITQIQ